LCGVADQLLRPVPVTVRLRAPPVAHFLAVAFGAAIAIVSYNGARNFGLVGDFNALHDLEALAGDFLVALEELADAAGVSTADGPWPAYDDATVAEINKRLHGADEPLLSQVRADEVEHKHRRGVMDATARELAKG
jgi:hypothetical protein